MHIALWSAVGIALLWSGWHPRDRFTWFMEVFPIFLGSTVLILLYDKFRFSRLICWFLALHAMVLLIGGHYTYAEVPLFNWIRDHWHLARNHYDRLGHFMQGFVPALVAREVLIRRGVLQRGPWLRFLIICICLAISAAYELLEWQTAAWNGSMADDFLGAQGDPWDAQKDMTMALIGAVCGLLFAHKAHDRSMRRLATQ